MSYAGRHSDMSWLSSSPLLGVRKPITGFTDYSSRSSQVGVVRSNLFTKTIF